MFSFAATLLALKFAESTRGLEFDGVDDVLGTAVIRRHNAGGVIRFRTLASIALVH